MLSFFPYPSKDFPLKSQGYGMLKHQLGVVIKYEWLWYCTSYMKPQ